jgi:hypothetical protein
VTNAAKDYILLHMAADVQPAKRVYEKPELTVIDFSADEVMAVGCKVSTGGSSKLASPGCFVSSCFQEGS